MAHDMHPKWKEAKEKAPHKSNGAAVQAMHDAIANAPDQTPKGRLAAALDAEIAAIKQAQSALEAGADPAAVLKEVVDGAEYFVKSEKHDKALAHAVQHGLKEQ